MESRYDVSLMPLAVGAARALTVLLNVLVAESAVETMWRGSPVRWTVVAVATSYAVAMTLVWRRLTWRLRALAAAGILLGTAATTAWLPGGITAGMSVGTLSSSSVLSLAVAVGVTIAALAIRAVERVPRVVKTIVLVLAAYGVLAFVSGVFTGTPFTSLLAGQSAWQRLPRFLQGAVIGGLVVLPLGVVAVCIRAGLRRAADGSPVRMIQQGAALVATLAIVLAGLPERAAPTAATTADSPGDPAARIAQLDASLRALEYGDRESPRDRWDPEYLVQQVGRDPQALFNWVRENTFWIPYRGLLRGPVGVLLDRQGNSLDRALLLAALLEKAGHTVRLAHGAMERGRALAAVPELVGARSRGLPAMIASDAMLPSLLNAGITGIDAARVGVVLRAQNDDVTRAVAALDERVPEQTDRLLRLIAHPATASWKGRLDAAVEAVRDHWWVQALVDSEWRDFDVAMQRGVGEALAEASQTFPPSEIDVGLRHELVVRVVAEKWSNDRVVENRVLESIVRPDEAIGQPIIIQFWPTGDQAAANGGRPGVANERRQHEEYAAALLIGANAIPPVIIQDTGDVRRQTGGPLGGLGAAITNSLVQSDSQQDPTAQTELTAVWLEYEIRGPGLTPQVVRRAVFDLLPPGARQASRVPRPEDNIANRRTRTLALTMRTEVLPQTGAMAPEFVVNLARQTLLGNRTLLRAAAQHTVPADPAADQGGTAAPPVTPLYSLAVARFGWGGMNRRVFVDRINVLTRHRVLAGSGDRLALRDAVDIVANDVGVDLAVDDEFAARLEHGVLDTNAEGVFQFGTHAVGNVAEAFSKSREWLVFTAGQGPSVGERIPRSLRPAIEDDLSRGLTVVAPAREATVGENAGWWRIDPRTGTTIGIAAGGWGQSESGVQYNLLVVMARGWAFQEAFCRAVPYAFVLARPFLNIVIDAYAPDWWKKTLPPQRDDKTSYEAGKSICLFGFMMMGVLATLPLVMKTLRFLTLGVGRNGMPSAAAAAGRGLVSAGSGRSGPPGPPPPVEPPPPARRGGAPASPAAPGEPGPPKPPEECPPGAGGAPPQGPYRGDEFGRNLLENNPDSEWVRRSGIDPQDMLDAMRKADTFAEAAYNDARRSGMSDASANKVSEDAWNDAFNRQRPRWNYWNPTGGPDGRGAFMREPPRQPAGATQPLEPSPSSIPAGEMGPYQGDPVGAALIENNPDTDAVQYMGGQKTIDALKKADGAALRAYQDARASGMSDASANQISKDVWNDAFNRNRGYPIGAPIPQGPGGTAPLAPPSACGSPLGASVVGVAGVNDAVGGGM